MTDCCICGRPAGRLYHALKETENGTAHYVCWRDREAARKKHEKYASTNR